MSSAAESVSILRKKARRQKWLIGTGAVIFTLVAFLTANAFGLFSWWIEWPLKFVIYAIAAASWGYSAKAINARVDSQIQALEQTGHQRGATPR